MRDIGKNIKSIRLAKNMTQEALADALYVTRQTVSNYENGRSRPDLDMLLKIAEVLETDVNTVLYGPPIPQNKKRIRRWSILSCGLALLIVLLYAVLEPMLQESFAKTFRTDILLIRYWNKELLLPLALFLLGWELLHGLHLLRGLHQLQPSKAKTGRILLAVLSGIFLLVQLPFYIWQTVGAVRSWLYSSVSMVFPRIPVYYEILRVCLFLTYKVPIVYCILGGLYWLMGIPPLKPIDKPPG